MYKIIDGRGTGKTGRLLLLAKETGATVACKEPLKLIEKANCYGIEGLHIIGYSDVVDGEDIGNILVDDLEEFAKFVIGFTNIEDADGEPVVLNRLVGYSISDK